LKLAKKGVGEVAMPIIASTATTLAAFIPLVLWDGMLGEFMQWLPITLIIVLSSSLFVALVINPMLISLFMKVIPKKENKLTFIHTLEKSYQKFLSYALKGQKSLWYSCGYIFLTFLSRILMYTISTKNTLLS